jgi:hypothetical protein
MMKEQESAMASMQWMRSSLGGSRKWWKWKGVADSCLGFREQSGKPVANLIPCLFEINQPIDAT